MLNSAAGVRLPSPTEPPISTIRSGRASGASASSSATFVSGPVGTSVSAPSRSRISLARNCTACSSTGRPGEAAGRGRRARSRRGRARRRRACARADPERPRRRARRRARTARAREARSRSSSRASGSPRRCVTPSSSTSGEASASMSAIASSCPGSQSMTIGVGIAANRPEASPRCRTRAEATSARRSSPPRMRPPCTHAGVPPRGTALEQAHDEAGRERVAGAGPVDRDDRRRGRAGHLLAVLEEHGALVAVGHGDELSPLHDLVLEPVDDQQVGLEVEHPGRRGVQGEELGFRRRRIDDLVRHLELGQHGALDLARRHVGIRPGEHGDLVLALQVDVDQRDTRLSRALDVELDPGLDQARQRLVGERVVADGADHPHLRAHPRGRDGLVRALAAGEPLELPRRDGLPRPGQPLHPRDEVDVDRTDDGELDCHAAQDYAARACRSSCARPSRFSRRSKRPAQSEPRSGAAWNETAAERPSSARTSTASSR